MSAGVYRITHIASGKNYVGSSMWVADRWRVHRQGLANGSHHSKHLLRAWRKYGEDAFEFVLLERTPPDVALLLSREQHYMGLFDVCNPARGYNSAQIAGSNAGNKLSEEARKRIGDGLRGRKQSEEHKRRKADAIRGSKRTPESREKIKQAALCRDPESRVLSEGVKCKIRAAKEARGPAPKRRSVSEEVRERSSKRMKGNKNGVNAMSGKTHSPGTKEKMRQSALRRGPLPEEVRAKISATKKAKLRPSEEASLPRPG